MKIPKEWLQSVPANEDDPCTESNFSDIVNPRIRAVRIEECKKQQRMQKEAKIRQARIDALYKEEEAYRKAIEERSRIIEENRERLQLGLELLDIPPLPVRKRSDFKEKCEHMKGGWDI